MGIIKQLLDRFLRKPVLYCINCKKELEGKKEKFCSQKCLQHWNYHNNPIRNQKVKERARKVHEQMKDDPEFKRKAYLRTKSWTERNRKRYNAYMKSYMNKNWRKYDKEKTA